MRAVGVGQRPAVVRVLHSWWEQPGGTLRGRRRTHRTYGWRRGGAIWRRRTGCQGICRSHRNRSSTNAAAMYHTCGLRALFRGGWASLCDGESECTERASWVIASSAHGRFGDTDTHAQNWTARLHATRPRAGRNASPDASSGLSLQPGALSVQNSSARRGCLGRVYAV